MSCKKKTEASMNSSRETHTHTHTTEITKQNFVVSCTVIFLSRINIARRRSRIIFWSNYLTRAK